MRDVLHEMAHRARGPGESPACMNTPLNRGELGRNGSRGREGGREGGREREGPLKARIEETDNSDEEEDS